MKEITITRQMIEALKDFNGKCVDVYGFKIGWRYADWLTEVQDYFNSDKAIVSINMYFKSLPLEVVAFFKLSAF